MLIGYGVQKLISAPALILTILHILIIFAQPQNLPSAQYPEKLYLHGLSTEC